jgi:hypothetical protein
MDRATLLAAAHRKTPCSSCGHACLCTAHCRARNESFEIATGAVPPGGDTLHCLIETHACAYTLECVTCPTAT